MGSLALHEHELHHYTPTGISLRTALTQMNYAARCLIG